MTFDEWWENNGIFGDSNARILVRGAWDASAMLALSAIRAATVEECAKVCDGEGDKRSEEHCGVAYDCAEALRAMLTTGEKK